MEYKNKRGLQLSDAVGAILTLVLLAVLVIVAVYMFGSLGDASVAPNTAGAAVNETFTPNTTGVNLAASNLISGSCGTITAVYNVSGQVITSTNWTQSGCLVSNLTSLQAARTAPWRVNYPYTYSAPTGAYNASGDMIDQFGTYPALVGLVGTIIFLGIVIGVLVAAFVFGGKRGA